MSSRLRRPRLIINREKHRNRRPGHFFTMSVEALEQRCLLAGGFDLIGLTSLRNDPEFAGIDGSGVTVAIIDSGVDVNHPLLAPNIVAGYNAITGGSDPTPVSDHGTHVSGIVGATDPEIGVAIDVDLIGVQVFRSVPGVGAVASNSDIETALEWILENRDEYNIVAVNMSLGDGGFYTSQAQAASSILFDDIQRLEAAGVTVVSAAGNSYGVLPGAITSQPIDRMYPNAASPGILSTLNVGAIYEENEGQRFIGYVIDFTTAGDRVAGFSQRPPLDAGNAIFAPGALINSTIPGNGQTLMAGTSMASPMIAGAVALMQEAAFEFGGRYLAPQEAREILLDTADMINDGDDERSSAVFDANGNGIILVPDELVPFQPTNQNYPRLNIHAAVREIKRRFDEMAPGSNEKNGTIAGAYLGPSLNGTNVSPIDGTIGADGPDVPIGPADVDMIRFEVASPGTVILDVETQASDPDDFDSYLRLFDESGSELATNNDKSSSDPFSRIEAELGLGVYYAGVSGFANSNYDPTTAGSGIDGDTGNYTLRLALANDDLNGLLSGALEVNLREAQQQVFDGNLGTDSGTPVNGSDVDMGRIVVPDDGTLVIDIDTPVEAGFADTYLRVFDETGTELVTNQNALSRDSAGNFTEFTDGAFPGLVFEDPVDRTNFRGHVSDSFLIGNVTRGDVFYVAVSEASNTSYDPNTLDGRPAGAGGSYQAVISFFNRDLNGSIPQAVDLTSTELPLVEQSGVIGADPDGSDFVTVGDRDVDFARIITDQAGIFEIDINSYTAPSIDLPVDTVLYLYDANGNILAGNDGVDGLDPVLRYETQAGVEYFVAVVGAGNEDFDPFQLGSGSPGATGDYQWNMQLYPPEDLPDFLNDGANFGGVLEIALGNPVMGFIGNDAGLIRGPADVDIYQFVPEQAGNFRIRTDASQAYSADTFLRVFDAAGNELGVNDDHDGTKSSMVELSLAGGQTYWIGVNGSSDQADAYDPFTGEGAAAAGQEGDYQLVVETRWHNVDSAVDVDGENGSTPTPLDALLAVNELTSREYSAPVSGLLDVKRFPPPYVDVDDDGYFGPLDALLVINALPNTSMAPLSSLAAVAPGTATSCYPLSELASAGKITPDTLAAHVPSPLLQTQHAKMVTSYHPAVSHENASHLRYEVNGTSRVELQSVPQDDLRESIDHFFAGSF